MAHTVNEDLNVAYNVPLSVKQGFPIDLYYCIRIQQGWDLITAMFSIPFSGAVTLCGGESGGISPYIS